MSTKAKVIAWIVGGVVMTACVMFWDIQLDDAPKSKTPHSAPSSEPSSVDYSL